MLLTAPLLSKSSFFGSLLSKCRQVIIKSPKKPTTTNNAIKNTNKNDNFTLTTAPKNNKTAPTTSSAKRIKTNTLNTSSPAIAKLTINNNTSTTTTAHISTTATAFKTVEEQIGLPPRPKKPLTPYFRYMRELRPKMMAENPKRDIKDIIRELSKKWVTVDQKVKDRLLDEFKRDQQLYVEQRAKYDAKVTDEQRSEIKQLKQDIAEAKVRRMMRKRVQELGRPKRPLSAFLRFVQYERKATPQLEQETYREWHQRATAKWSRLTDDEKERFKKESREEMELYKKERDAWETRMIKQGNIDVVRSTSLIDPPEPKPKKR